MNTQKYLSTLKFFPALLGLTSISVLTSLPAVASQTSLLTTNNKDELLIAQVETEVETPAAEDPAAASDTPDDASQDAAAEDPATGGAEQPTEDPAAASDTPDDASQDAAAEEVPEDPATGGAEQPTEDPATDATPADAEQPGLQAPPTTPPVMTPPAATPPEGGATQPLSEPAAPSEDAAPTEVAPEGATPVETEEPSTSTPGADDLKPEADANQDAQPTISEAELKQFVTAIPQLSMIEKTTQGEVTQIIGQSGLSQDKFNALLSGQQTNTPPAETSAEEKQSFEQAITKIQEIEKKGQAEQEQIIRSKGMEPQRFSQILAAVRQDQNLRTKVQEMLTTN